jgi:iron complex transport system ATP-binding protein
MAAAYAHRVIVLREGRVVADGAPEEALRTDRLRAVFDVPAELLRAPDGRHWIRYGD